MKIAIPKERRAGEARVAVSADTVKKYVQMGFDVVVETGAGAGASMADSVYQDAGATIAPDAASAFDADVVLKIQRPTDDEIALFKEGTVLIAGLAALTNKDMVEKLAARKVTA
ncbi:MAG: NAD(P)(+) transhydrogenase (Re/Si-specific) subunit alpha, partial [Magnetospirillum sp.]|nr:NAD(P)(+) transhydrogenase (Re/Si-specific) subunit alpha [Magnetospirillum sp.]